MSKLAALGQSLKIGQSPSSNLPITLLLTAYFVLGTLFALTVPLGEGPDELDHYHYVRYLVEEHRFPVMQPEAAANATMEANQPPLFYLLNAVPNLMLPLAASVDFRQNPCFTFDLSVASRAHFYLHTVAEERPLTGPLRPFYVSRLLSVLLGGLTVLTTFGLGRQVTDKPVVPLLAAGLLAFNPQFLFMMATVNNDVLMALLGAVTVGLVVQAAQRPTLRLFTALGIAVGLGLLTKFALLALWPLALLAAFAPLVQGKGMPNGRFLLHALARVLALPPLLAGWWYGRAYRLYGDPLAWEVHLQAKGAQVLRQGALGLSDLLDFGRIHFQSYWGWFGWLRLPLPTWAYGLLLLFVLAAAVGLLRTVRGYFSWPLRLTAGQTAVLFHLLTVAAIYTSLLRYIQTINWSGYQGRLAYAAAAAVALLLALGWEQLVGQNRRFLAILPLAGLGLLAAGSLLWIVKPAYARPALYEPAADLGRSCVWLADVQVEAVATTDGHGGGTLPVTVYGFGTAVGQERPFTLTLWHPNGQLLGEATQIASWKQGSLLTLPFDLPIPAEIEPLRGELRLRLGDEERAVGTAVVRGEWPDVQPQTMVDDLNFGGVLALRGYAWADDGVVLYWQATGTVAADYTTFVHVVDADGVLLAQADGQPQAGVYPTSVWLPTERVPDVKRWEVLDGKRPLRLLVGVYLLETGERLPLVGGGDTAELLRLGE